MTYRSSWLTHPIFGARTTIDIQSLLDQLETQERDLLTLAFLAPCVRGGRVRTQLAGLTYTFWPEPRDFEGWGIFQPQDARTAECVKAADLAQIDRYLHEFEVFRFFLVRSLQHRTWLAFPANLADMKQRLGWAKPVPVHLVDNGISFEPIVARYDGRVFWFESGDRRADPLPSEALRQAFRECLLAANLNFRGIAPEMRFAYDLATQDLEAFSSISKDEKRLRAALKMGGGELKEFRNCDDYWQVEWTTADGVQHASAISKADLTVISAGICLDGRDRDFDLQSLVGVIEREVEDWYP